MTHFEIAIVGAGMAGLTCSQQLHQAGYNVVVVEKSRGLGGRLATRRLEGTHADHGVCYLKPKDDRFQSLVKTLVDRAILQRWTDTIHELDANGQVQEPRERPLAGNSKRSPRYASPMGFSAIAKFLATGLALIQNQRVAKIELIGQKWHLQFENNSVITADAVIVAIPAPQALIILESIPDSDFLQTLKSVQYSACIAAIATYPSHIETDLLDWKAIVCPHDSDLGWIAIDSTKQLSPSQPVFVVQSNAAFAHRHLDTSDLQPVGQHLLDKAAQILPWLSTPEVLQVHRWRYAFPTQPLTEKYLIANTQLPLICTGDWCGGNRVESAFLSGLATAEQINLRLRKRSLNREFWRAMSPKI
ncbi:NAD(P)/FAD-dependent oxidoreductase [Phormidesmis sp. 146-33]